MGQFKTEREAPSPAFDEPICWMLDPLEDGMGDEAVTLTHRQIVRITLVATEVGARFQREGIRTDPMGWMLVPRRVFNGKPPIEACITRGNCAKAVLIHGLGLDLDIGPAGMATLMDESPQNKSEHLEAAD